MYIIHGKNNMMTIFYALISIPLIAMPFEAIDYIEFRLGKLPKRWWYPAAFLSEIPITLFLWWAMGQ